MSRQPRKTAELSKFLMAHAFASARLSRLQHSITIIGGGLAGLSLAIALRRRDISTTVIEAGNYPRHKVCGEFISGVRAETLRALGIDGLFSDARRHQTLAWHDQGRLFLSGVLPERALGISRYQLDERLRVEFMAQGGELITGRREKPIPTEGQVWAAGRSIGSRNPPDQPDHSKPAWLGLKAHVRINATHDLEMHSGTNGYAGLAGVEDGWTNVCGLFRLDRDIRAHGSELLPAYLDAGGNHQLASSLRNAAWRENSFSSVAGFNLGRQPSAPGMLCLGDADRMIPPFTGNGMSMAFQAAECAVKPLAAWAAGACTWRQCTHTIQQLLNTTFRHRLMVASLLHRGLLHTGGRAALRSLAASGILPFRMMLSWIR